MGMNPYKIRRLTKLVLIQALLITVTITCLFPLFWMVRSSLMTQDAVFVDQSIIPSRLHFGNYVRAWTQGQFGRYFLNSVVYTTIVVFGIVVISSWAAYAFSRLKFPGRKLFFVLFILAVMIPLPGSFVPLTVLMTKIGFINSPYSWVRQLGYILCMINVGLPLSVFLLKTFFDQMPSDLEDAARIDGCNKMGIWRHVALPLARPAIAVIVIFNALNVWNEYLLARLLLNDVAGKPTIMPLQRGVMVFADTHNVEYPLLMASLTIAAVPIILVYLFVQKHILAVGEPSKIDLLKEGRLSR
jgi:multiple sugar transport system permease protein/raffinose/stachyose/melibiose transport system permease protein